MIASNEPPGESPKRLMTERTVLSGIFLMCIAYGMEVMLFLATVQLLLKRKMRNMTLIFVYVTVLFVLASIATGCAIQQEIWDFVDNRNFPGGPISFSLVDGQDPIYLTMLMAFNLMSILQDGYLLYRLLVVWNRNFLVFILPALLYLASIATSFLIWAEILMTGAPFISAAHIDLGLTNWVLSISTNLVLTALIVLRIFLARRAALGDAGQEHVKTYMSVASMLVESQAIYAIIGIVVLIGVKTNERIVDVLSNTFGIMEAFAPTLVAYRVAKGTAWSRDTARAELSTIRFPRGTTPRTTTLFMGETTNDAANFGTYSVPPPASQNETTSQEEHEKKIV